MLASRSLIALGLAFAFAGGALARPVPTAQVTLAPTSTQTDVSTLVTQLLSNSRYHYHPLPLDDALSERIYDRYLEALDRDRMFLLASDVAGFASLRTRFDDALRERQIQPAFDMFNIYVQRVADRTRFAREFLKSDIDFSGDETWDFDRKNAPFADSSDALDALWRKRVKNDVLPAPTSCRFCLGEVKLVNNAEFYGREYGWPLAYRCSCCGARVGTHPGTDFPLGTLADEQTMKARMAAHEAFDSLWKGKGPLRRAMAYKALAKAMCMRFAHISWMDATECHRVVTLCRSGSLQI